MTSRRKESSGGRKTGQPKTTRAAPAPRPDSMSDDVMEFINAIDEYKRSHQRPFPTWSEVLEILKTLGYQRQS
jgi:hypothetical protein